MTYYDQPGFRGSGGPAGPSVPPQPPTGAPAVPPPGPPPGASPAALAPDLSFANSVGTGVGPRSRDRYKPLYSYQARSPLPHLVVVLVFVGVAVFALSNFDSTVYDPSGTVVDGSTSRSAVQGTARTDEGMALLGFSALILGFIALCILIGRIGRNVRGFVRTFGAWTAAVALPLWHQLFLVRVDTMVTYSNGTYTYGSLLATYVVGLLLALIGYCILQARLFSRIWEAGRFGGERWSGLLWAPPAVGWLTLYVSAIFTIVSIGEDGSGTSRWVPTDTMALFTGWAVVASNLGLLALLVAVSVAQHRGIATDREAIRAERANPDRQPGQSPAVG